MDDEVDEESMALGVRDWGLVQAGVEYQFNEETLLELSWHRRQEEGVRD